MSCTTKWQRCFCVALLPGAIACAEHPPLLFSGDSPLAARVYFYHEGNDGPSMSIEFDGAVYERRGFAIEKKQNLNELRVTHGPGKHYDQIVNGQDRQHLRYSATPVLTAADGRTMRCDMYWITGSEPSGVCTTSSGDKIHVRGER